MTEPALPHEPEVSHGNPSMQPPVYDASQLHWNSTHTVNSEHCYCYCGADRRLDKVDFMCMGCRNFFHQSCTKFADEPLLPLQTCYEFWCRNCSTTSSEVKTRPGATPWKALCASAMANMIVESFAGANVDLSSRNQAAIAQLTPPYFTPKGDVVRWLSRPDVWVAMSTGRAPLDEDSLASHVVNAIQANRLIFRALNEHESRTQDSAYTLVNMDMFQFRAGYIAPVAARSRKRKLSTGEADSAAREPRDRKESWKKQQQQQQQNSSTPASKMNSPAYPDIQALWIRPPPYQDSDFSHVGKAPVLQPVPTPKLASRSFYQLEEVPFNRRGFRYYACEAVRSMPGIMYRRCELPPYLPGIELADQSPLAFVSEDMTAATSNSGFRMVRSNICLRSGTYYYEIKVHQSAGDNGGHVRLGLARREASLEAPVGFDAYSYGLRDVGGQAMHMSRPREFMRHDIQSGDVIGFEVTLPGEAVKEPIIRDRIPIRYRGQLYFEMFEYTPSKDMEDLALPAMPPNRTRPEPPPPLKGSSVRVYRNGELVGTAFEDLWPFLPPYSQIQRLQHAHTAESSTSSTSHAAKGAVTHSIDDGMLGYYPAMSVFKGGCAEFNFGPQFAYPMPTGARAACERYVEQIAEDVVYDVVDEVLVEEALQESQVNVPVADARAGMAGVEDSVTASGPMRIHSAQDMSRESSISTPTHGANGLD